MCVLRNRGDDYRYLLQVELDLGQTSRSHGPLLDWTLSESPVRCVWMSCK